MANILFSNNASSLLAASIISTDLTLQVGAGEGALFPNPSGAQYFMVALQDAAGNLELVQCTGRATDILTIVRAQEGTTALDWTLGVTRVELRLTQGIMEAMVQTDGDTMAGSLDMNENNLVDAQLTGVATKMLAGQVVNVPIRGVTDDDSNELAVPTDGSRATAGGSALLTQADLVSGGGLNFLPIASIILWYGTLGSLPTGWQNCDGTNGSPDLRDKFVRGAGLTYALGATGGAATAAGTTAASGAGTTGSHVLTEAEMPAHNHLWRGTDTGSVAVAGEATADAFAAVKGTTGDSFRDTFGSGQIGIDDAGSGGGHTHTTSNHTHTLSSIATIPPYVAVYYIMKVA